MNLSGNGLQSISRTPRLWQPQQTPTNMTDQTTPPKESDASNHETKGGCQQELVRLEYEGKPWTAERLKTSSYVHFKNAANPNDGMMWAVPDERMSELAWRIYHTNYIPTREELFGMLSVIDSYRSLLAKPAKRQRTLARVLLKFIQSNAAGELQTPPTNQK
jgi:hypothetical protein